MKATRDLSGELMREVEIRASQQGKQRKVVMK